LSVPKENEMNRTGTSDRKGPDLAPLRDSERNFRLLVQSVTDYAIYMLDPSGRVVTWNAGAERIKGYSPDEIIGYSFSRFFTPEDREAGVPDIALKSAAETGRFESEGWRIRKDGTRFWAMAVIDSVRDENGSLIGFAKITRDMTERREAQLRLERAHEQLAQAQKMEALGQLTGGVAHDFNNLLMIVSGQAQLLKKRTQDPRDLRSVEAIEQAAKSGASLTRQLLTFSRRQQLNPLVLRLDERLGGLVDLLTSALGGIVKLVSNIPSDIWPVEVDAAEFEIALVNIAVNARDSMPNGGTLTLAARNVVLDGKGVPQLEGEFVALSLTDTGTGIAPELLPKIFEPFFTTKEIGKGTGLGLSQVFGFARQSRGDVVVTSEVGKGTKATMYLPRSRRIPDTQTPRKTSGAIRGTGTILVVEDNPEVADVSTMLLTEMGYEVLRAERASDALQILCSRNDIKLMFSDIVMPGDMDGFALARAVRDKFPGLPVLLATGYSPAAAQVQTHTSILRKPYDADALAEAIRNTLALARAV
jgi:PAS domain S-box-containing protein